LDDSKEKELVFSMLCGDYIDGIFTTSAAWIFAVIAAAAIAVAAKNDIVLLYSRSFHAPQTW
jgi:hypothetical protein